MEDQMTDTNAETKENTMTETKKGIFEEIAAAIQNDETLSAEEKAEITANIGKFKDEKLNIMLVGATGAGKSSTINAIFDTEVAKVGYSCDPETSSIQKYEIGNLVLWDTPGLGDSPEKDSEYAAQIVNALKMKDAEGAGLIDEVVVVVDACSRDLGTTYEMLKNVISPYIDPQRILVALNQYDIAMKGRHWNEDENRPEEPLAAFLNEKSASVKRRIGEFMELSGEPVWYSALYRYNISKLLLAMLMNMPEEKRFIVADTLNKDPEVWTASDGLRSYGTMIQQEIRFSFEKAVMGARTGARIGGALGEKFIPIPVVGRIVGEVAGGILGFLWGGASAPFKHPHI